MHRPIPNRMTTGSSRSATTARSALAGLFCAAIVGAGCAAETGSSEDDLTSASGAEKRVTWQSFVYVPTASNDSVIQKAIQKQIKSAIGAFRGPEIGIQDRDALTTIDAKLWIRDDVEVVDEALPAVKTTLTRVRYTYTDTAIVRKKNTTLEQQIPLLFGDYVAKVAALKPACSDDQKTAADSMWYHYTPQQAACKTMIAKETSTINTAAKGLNPTKQISKLDSERNFVMVRAKFTAVKAPPTKYPEYDKLWGFGTDRQLLVTYAFFGVDADIADPNDVSAIEHFRFLRTLLAKYPTLAVTTTDPFALLLDFDIAGSKYVAAYAEVCNWVVDNSGFPKTANTLDLQNSLRKQALQHWAERWVYWELPVTITINKQPRNITIQLRSYWGHEDGTAQWRQAATNRYLEAFWHGDIFMYQGHSHFGHGPLEPINFATKNFPDRYQVMLVNSCLSFNYYDVDFLKMHPGTSSKLDIVVNGLPAFWTKMGEASANMLIGLTDGTGKSWVNVLEAMIVKPSWAPNGYDPLRAVNGELDNVFDASKAAMSLVIR
ncbi:MAG: hypothetical protein EXR77_11535 [Myxococcales bacterium]|nr:hypothetical protein [Myxococcales bacterium]